jgi:hypothetical protein
LSRNLAVRLARLEARRSGDLMGGRADLLGSGSGTVTLLGYSTSGEVVPLGCRDRNAPAAPASRAGEVPEGFGSRSVWHPEALGSAAGRESLFARFQVVLAFQLVAGAATMGTIISRRPAKLWWFRADRFSLRVAAHAVASFRIRTVWARDLRASSSVASRRARPR